MSTTTVTPSVAEQMLTQARRLLDLTFLADDDIALAEVYLEAGEVARQHPGGAEDVLAAAVALRKAEDRRHPGDRHRNIAAARLRLRVAAASHAAGQVDVEENTAIQPKPAPRYVGTPPLRGFGS